MFNRRLLATSFLATLLALTLGFQPAAVAGTGTGPPPTPCPHGPAAGTWNLPSAGMPGQAQGTLFTPSGGVAFGLNASVVLDPSTGTTPFSGRISGVLVHPPSTGTTPSVFARVRGRWVSNADGIGFFRAVVFRPETDTSPAEFLGRIRGRFNDSQSSPSPNGHFVGQWRICP